MRGVHRAAGTSVGELVAAALLSASYPTPVLICRWSLPAPTELLVTRDHAVALMFATR